ncbi:hypothetical protein BDQ17DRAFT_1321094 [Cyathus striatus]|nr:hypothetical protein BDQ17DRAFT_1321094 [Cyathus striatus]
MHYMNGRFVIRKRKKLFSPAVVCTDIISFIRDIFPPASKVGVPDLTGKVMLVIGGNTGLGKETAQYSPDLKINFTSYLTMGHYYLTKLLLPLLTSTAKFIPERKARIIQTASIGHILIDHLYLNTFKDGPARRKMTEQKMYSQSKLATIMYSNELACRYGSEGIVSVSLHPGNIVTEVQRNLSPIMRFIFYGAPTRLYAGTSAEALNTNGKYLIPWARVGDLSSASKDVQVTQELWNGWTNRLKPSLNRKIMTHCMGCLLQRVSYPFMPYSNFLPKPALTIEGIPDLTEKIVIITGANTVHALRHFSFATQKFTLLLVVKKG